MLIHFLYFIQNNIFTIYDLDLNAVPVEVEFNIG